MSLSIFSTESKKRLFRDTGPTHRFNHTLDLIISHGNDLTDIDIVLKVMMLLTILLYRACCILMILTIWLHVIVQAELLFQSLKTDSPITCLIYLNCSMYHNYR